MSFDGFKNLKIAPLDLPEITIARAKGVGGAPSAMVDAGSIVAFAGGVDAQDQEDVLYSMQLAQRAASGAADRYTKIDDWYREYSRVLQLTGWIVKGFAPVKQSVAEGEYQMAKAALEIVAAAATGPQTVILTAAIKALEGLAADDGFITLFEHFGIEGSLGNFQMGAVERGPDGALSMTLGAFQMTMSENQKKFLFFKWRTRDVTVWADAQAAVFNRKHYATQREQVEQMLGKDAQKAIAQLHLAPLK